MTIIKTDFNEILTTLRRQSILTAEEVFGQLKGSVRRDLDLERFRLVDDFTLLQNQYSSVIAPLDVHLFRKGMLAFQFTASGHYQRLTDQKIDYVTPASVIISNAPRSTIQLPKGLQIKGISLAIERDYFIERYGLNINSIPSRYRPLFTAKGGVLFSMKLPLSEQSWACIEQINRCSYGEPLRGIYIKAKAQELICDVVSVILAGDLINRIDTASSNRLEMQMLEAAAAIYARELENPPSVAEIAARVGLHRIRLISGFQERFMEPPSSYSRRLRLERAKELLATTNFSIVQVAQQTGYTNHSAFTRAFRHHFGHSPSDRGEE